METIKLHTGLYGKKAEQIISLCWRVSRGDLPIQREDLHLTTRQSLLQNDVFMAYLDSTKNDPGWLVTHSHFFESSSKASPLVFSRSQNSSSIFDSRSCFNVEMNEVGEVCCIINRTRFEGLDSDYEKLKKTLLEKLYEALKSILPVIYKKYASLCKSMSRAFDTDGIWLEHIVAMTFTNYGMDVTIGEAPLLKKNVTITGKDIKVMLDAIWRLAQTLEYDGTMWKPHEGVTYSEEEYYDVIGREEADPFVVSKNVIVQDKVKSMILTFISNCQDEVRELEEKMENLKRSAINKVIRENAKDYDEVSLLLS